MLKSFQVFPIPYFLTLKLYDLLYPPARQADKEVQSEMVSHLMREKNEK